jgi:carboxyl-terminal processing protease
MNSRKIALTLSLGLSFFSAFAQNTPPMTKGDRLNEIMRYIERQYVDTVNSEQLYEAAVNSMLEKLDPHTSYIPKAEVDEAMRKIDGSFVGIGIRFQILKDTLMVVETVNGGPSEKLGIRAGDKIVSVDGINIAGIGLKNSQVREKLMGELGTKVRVDVVRKKSKKPINYVITRDRIPENSVDCAYMVAPHIGYIKLTSFSRSSYDEMMKALNSLKEQGMEHLILDLQSNGGGLMYAAQQIADEFLSGNKLIVYSQGRARPRRDEKAGKQGVFESGKLIVLTDEYTASASEIVSGAIQDWDRGLIVGRRTYGKGLVQQPIELSDGGQLRLTIARYYTPSGRFIQRSYENLDDYKNEYMRRFMHGELSTLDSIKLPDSLKFETNITKRPVYGGGGIMPDFFVPIDTSQITTLYRDMFGTGAFNTFPLTYVDKNRDVLHKQYETLDKFISEFKIDATIMNEFLDFIKKEKEDFKMNDEQFKTSKSLIELRLKAMIANDLFGVNGFYQIFNSENEILQRAIQIIQSGEYDKQNLAK